MAEVQLLVEQLIVPDEDVKSPATAKSSEVVRVCIDEDVMEYLVRQV